MQWEYVTHTIEIGGWLRQTGNVDVPEVNHSLNWFGQQGWELVTAFDTNIYHGGSRNIVLMFKRPVQAKARERFQSTPP